MYFNLTESELLLAVLEMPQTLSPFSRVYSILNMTEHSSREVCHGLVCLDPLVERLCSAQRRLEEIFQKHRSGSRAFLIDPLTAHSKSLREAV